ncbi:MAG: cupin domain-containing protein [Coxiellaceae bacterium]|nr:MAG: cupin domain-containing protein [Coxiellaceae bacterium]
MQALAELAQVSKSMICKIEQNKVQPTLDVAARLAAALDRTLSEMLHPNVKARTVYIPAGEQAVWHDAQHIIRKLLSPVFEGMTLEWLQVTLPAQTSISCLPMPLGGEKYVYMLKGELEIPVAGEKIC